APTAAPARKTSKWWKSETKVRPSPVRFALAQLHDPVAVLVEQRRQPVLPDQVQGADDDEVVLAVGQQLDDAGEPGVVALRDDGAVELRVLLYAVQHHAFEELDVA